MVCFFSCYSNLISMKFGKYLKERKKHFGDAWQPEFLDYKVNLLGKAHLNSQTP